MRETDRKILLELLEDCRRPIYAIAERVGVSRQTVAKKIEKFVSQGLIRSFTARLNPSMFNLNLRAYVLMDVEPDVELRRRCGEEIRRIPQITQFHYLFGRFDAIAEVWARDQEELTRIVKRLHDLSGVRETETLIVHDTIKDAPESPFIGALMKQAGEASTARS